MPDDIQQLILQKIDDLDKKLDKIRTEDLPGFRVEMQAVKDQTSSRTTTITAIGGFLAVATSALLSKFMR